MSKLLTYFIAVFAIISLIIGSYGFVVFQGQVSDLQSSNTNLEISLSDIETSLNAIETQIEDYQETISEQQGSLVTIQGQVEDYQKTIDEQKKQISEYQQVTLVDYMGNVIVLDSPPERIVSLAPSNTEILFAVGAGDKVVGVTNYCNYPYNFTAWIEAGNMTSIGSHYSLAVEPIVALDPDLVIASTVGNSENVVNLKKLGYNVLVLETKTLDGLLKDILLVGRATGNEIKASNLVTEMRTRIDSVVNKVTNVPTTPKVYHEVWRDPLRSAGPGTFVDDLITLAGGENIFNDASTSWPTVSSETVIEKNPEVIFLPDNYMGETDLPLTIETIKDRAGWNLITAVQNDAIYEIDGNTISRAGPRLVDALELIAKMIHPEIFGYP